MPADLGNPTTNNRTQSLCQNKETKNNSDKDAAYFQYYSLLVHQQNMMQDYVRTSVYYSSILSNSESLFKDKIVMDVGAGSGILSFFAVIANCKLVYSVEASSINKHLETIINDANYNTQTKNLFLKNKIKLLKGRVEDVKEDLKVDTIVSEPIGVLLFHERMVESFLFARDNFLKENGKLLPNKSNLYLEFLSDYCLWNEQKQKARFWENSNFYGIDLSCLKQDANNEIFQMPVIGYFSKETIINKGLNYSPVGKFDFERMKINELYHINMEKEAEMEATAIIHAIGGWFDILFQNSNNDHPFVISTAPHSEPTHWQQVRFLLKSPLAVNKGQFVKLYFNMSINNYRSYDISCTILLFENYNSYKENPKAYTTRKEMFWRLSDQAYNYSTTNNLSAHNSLPENNQIYDCSYYDKNPSNSNTKCEPDQIIEKKLQNNEKEMIFNEAV